MKLCKKTNFLGVIFMSKYSYEFKLKIVQEYLKYYTMNTLLITRNNYYIYVKTPLTITARGLFVVIYQFLQFDIFYR